MNTSKFKKSAIVVILVIIATMITSQVAMAERIAKSVPAYEQEGSMWCWAATNKSLIKYVTSVTKSQSDLCYEEFGNRSTSQGANQNQIQDSLSDNSIDSSLQTNPLTFNGVKSQISNNKPIDVQMYRYDDNGDLMFHQNIIRGFDSNNNTTILFIDPADGDYHGQNYTDYCNGTHWDTLYWSWGCSIFDIED